MPKYVVLVRSDPASYMHLGPAEMQKLIEKYQSWAGKVAQQGALEAGRKLTDEAGRVLTAKANRVAVKDGPFGETKEIVGGFYVLKAESYEHATKLCEGHPVFDEGGSLELREIDFMGQPED